MDRRHTCLSRSSTLGAEIVRKSLSHSMSSNGVADYDNGL
jgi:hypothetical protein